MDNEEDQVIVAYDQLVTGVGRATWKAVLPMIVLFTASVVLVFREGGQRYQLLAVAALLSASAAFAYAVLVSATLKGHVDRGWVPMLITFAALIPFGFGCYLFFYEGLWRLLRLRRGFSAHVLLFSFLFAAGGYWLVSATHELSEIAKFKRAKETDNVAA
jgi:drug/metabolite transporter (DMT)-like permease